MRNEVKHPGLEGVAGIVAARVFRTIARSFIALRFVQ
jgi:hypothetical protein